MNESARIQPALIDRLQRRVTYLRLSVTDRCDFRCVYCMPEKMSFMPRTEILTADELARIAESFVAQGVTKIRLTGGEPLVRPDICTVVERLARIPRLKTLAMTSNGSRLSMLAQPLRDAGLQSLNISLDSLRQDRFKALTRTGELQDVLAGIDAAREAGFTRIKLNAVIMRGRNDDEIIDLVSFARREQLDISFIEEMPLGVIHEHERALSFMSSGEVLDQVRQAFDVLPCLDSSEGPSRYYRMTDSQIRVGVISPHSNNFCASCNRVRVTATGRLLLCLGHEHGVDLRDIVRASPYDSAQLQQTIFDAMPLKPDRHEFDLQQPPQIVRFMNTTGG
ncbi:MAG: GTP 3',8-cyclase MoaA [Pseudomonadota bacterium]